MFLFVRTSSNVREPIPQKTEVLVEHYLTSGMVNMQLFI